MRGRGRPPRLFGERRYPNRLRDLRARGGMSQQAVAAAARMSGAYYGALERGDKRINADTAARLAAALGCAVGDLLGAGLGASVPLVFAVAAAESETRPGPYDLPEPYERLHPHRLAQRENCVGAEVLDDSADVDFAPGSLLFARRVVGPTGVPVGAKVLVRFFLDPAAGADPGNTHEILYGILDRNIVGDLVLITRTHNRRVPRNMLIQGPAPGRSELAARMPTLLRRDVAIDYAHRAGDAAELLGIVIYAMGPV